jgi:dTDP-4-dehydrorhamnose reductase
MEVAMRVAITGSKGQLGLALQRVLTQEDLLLIDLPEHDITDLSAIVRTISLFRPEIVVHAAAMTDVERCEQDPEMAYRVNALGTRNMAVAAQECGASLVYISTDYVFDGGRDDPYWEFDDPNPLSVYGRSKWAGEQFVRSLAPRHYVARTAWLYGQGPRNFVETVLRLARERGSLRMVTDEIGSPTWAPDLAQALSRLIQLPAYGTYHLVNAGTCSRYDWAREILDLAGAQNVELLSSENYQRLARVPKHSELRNFCGAELGIVLRPWREALADYMQHR